MTSDLTELTIKRNRLSEQVVQQLEHKILGRELRPGDRLPSEREIGEQLNVSRTVVREAIKTLEQRGLVRVLTGSGTYISRADPGTVSRPLHVLIRQGSPSFENLIEVRRILELEIAALAAQHAADKDIAAMTEALQSMEVVAESANGDPAALECFAKADLAFHCAIVEAADNPLLSALLAPITELLLEFRRQASSVPGASQDALHFHRLILQSIRDREPMASRDLMREHLARAEEWGKLAAETLPRTAAGDSHPDTQSFS